MRGVKIQISRCELFPCYVFEADPKEFLGEYDPIRLLSKRKLRWLKRVRASDEKAHDFLHNLYYKKKEKK